MKRKITTQKKANKKDSNNEMDAWLEKADFSEAIKKGVWVHRNKGRPSLGRKISLIIPEETIEQITYIAKGMAMGYQTLARAFLVQKAEEEFKNKKKAG